MTPESIALVIAALFAGFSFGANFGYSVRKNMEAPKTCSCEGWSISSGNSGEITEGVDTDGCPLHDPKRGTPD